MAELLTEVEALLLLRAGKGSRSVAKDAELDEMRELYVGTGGTFKAWLRDDDTDGASTDFGTLPNNFRFPYDVRKIDGASGASGFVAIR